MKKLDWLILILLLLSPVIIHWTIINLCSSRPISVTQDGWLGFYGALLGSLITMFVLYRTRRWNKEDNDETRMIQTKILQYQAKQVWFGNLRQQLDNNYRLLNFQETVCAVNDIATGECKNALSILMELNRSIEMQGYTADLYFPVEDMSKEEEEYVAYYNNVLKQYGTYVNDLIIICGIRMRLQAGMSIDEYLRTSVSHLNALHEGNKEVEPSSFLISLVKVIDEGSTLAEIERICQSRAEETSTVHLLKCNLQAVTKALLKHEEQKIEDILNV